MVLNFVWLSCLLVMSGQICQKCLHSEVNYTVQWAPDNCYDCHPDDTHLNLLTSLDSTGLLRLYLSACLIILFIFFWTLWECCIEWGSRSERSASVRSASDSRVCSCSLFSQGGVSSPVNRTQAWCIPALHSARRLSGKNVYKYRQ